MPQFVLGEEVLFAIQMALAFLGAYFVAFWLALALWTYQDMKARSRSGVAQLLAVVLVALFHIPGLLLYLLLRPHETLAQSYERSLEEEAILQELDQRKLGCPTCRRAVQDDFFICPYCRSSLKRACPHCSRALNLAWRACPYCTNLVAGQGEPPARQAEASVGLAPEVRVPTS